VDRLALSRTSCILYNRTFSIINVAYWLYSVNILKWETINTTKETNKSYNTALCRLIATFSGAELTTMLPPKCIQNEQLNVCSVECQVWPLLF
jgi:hypothetical protein